LPLDTFPAICPWTWEELVGDGDWPQGEPEYVD
jgi:hypothetical protein